MRSNKLMNVFLFSTLVGGLAACAPMPEDPADDGVGGGADAAEGDESAADPGLDAGWREGAGLMQVPAPPISGGGQTALEPPSPTLDACGGLLVDVSENTDLIFAATTTGGNDDFKTWCGDIDASTSAPDVVYEIAVSQACVLDLTLTDSSGTFDPVLELHTGSCEVEQGGDPCSNRSGNVEELRFHAAAGATYWAVIDGSSEGDAGDFLFHIRCEPVTCGDGVQSPGEECDDGNNVSEDGCSATCGVEATPSANTCVDLLPTSASSHIGIGSPLNLPGTSLPFSTAGSGVTDDYRGSCSGEPGGMDQVFEIVPDEDGTLTATVGLDAMGVAYCQPPNYDAQGCRDHSLFVREADCESGTELACQESDPADLTNALSFPVTAGTHYFVFVDGYNGEWYSTGEYTLQLVLE